jgi:polyhydroxyalkanoate synthesis regulator phasin
MYASAAFAPPAAMTQEMTQNGSAPTRPWRPIGELLVDAGVITRAELDEALAEQRKTGQRLGEILIESGRISWLALAQAIGDQAMPGTARAEPAARPFSEAPEERLEEVESLLRERQRAFIELVSTTELLRRQVAQLEARLAERNDELARLRQSARNPS